MKILSDGANRIDVEKKEEKIKQNYVKEKLRLKRVLYILEEKNKCVIQVNYKELLELTKKFKKHLDVNFML